MNTQTIVILRHSRRVHSGVPPFSATGLVGRWLDLRSKGESE